MNRSFKQAVAVLAVFMIVFSAPPLTGEPEIVGWLEGAYLQPWGVRVRAKLDSGAKTSALHAENIEAFEQEGESWVRFHFPYGRRDGFPDGVMIEKPVVRETRIKHNNGSMGTEHRYVVELDVCISGKTHVMEVSLSERTSFNYPMLIGREAMAGRYLVDPSQSFLGNRTCPRGRDLLRSKKTPAKK